MIAILNESWSQSYRAYSQKQIYLTAFVNLIKIYKFDMKNVYCG
jgi:hypothetical protein